MSDPVNVSPDTRFDEATPDQFREFWEGQGWTADEDAESNRYFYAFKYCANGKCINVGGQHGRYGWLGVGENDGGEAIEFDEQPMDTFGEALRLANNLAQAELFGGWAE